MPSNHPGARGTGRAARGIRDAAFTLALDHKVRRKTDLAGNVKLLFDQRRNLMGDMLVDTIAFRAIKERHPEWQIHVLAGPHDRAVVTDNPCVDGVHPTADAVSTLSRLRAERFDVYYFRQHRLRLMDFMLLKCARASLNIGRAKSGYRLSDHSLRAPRGAGI